MRNRHVWFFVCFLLSMPGGGAYAQELDRAATVKALGAYYADAANRPDIRCLVVAQNLMQNSAADIRTKGFSWFLYYVAKVDGRAPSLDVENFLLAEVITMTPDDIANEAKRCGEQIQIKGAQYQDIGASMQKRVEIFMRDQDAGRVPKTINPKK